LFQLSRLKTTTRRTTKNAKKHKTNIAPSPDFIATTPKPKVKNKSTGHILFALGFRITQLRRLLTR